MAPTSEAPESLPPTPRVLIAPQEFKGSLTAIEAAAAITAGVREALPSAEVRELPLADGGPGTLELLHASAGGELRTVRVRGPLGDRLDAAWARLPDGTAVIEAASAAGLLLVPAEQRDPAHASSFGVGELLLAAIEAGSHRLIVGIGGTGTNDGGAGAAQALGLRLLDAAGANLPRGGLALSAIDRIEAAPAPRHGTQRPDLDVRIAVDVTNPLLGPEGATAIYGPQKGVTAELRPRLEAALERWAEVVARDLGIEVATMPGAGAGGGLPAGLIAAFGGQARIEPGAAVVAEAAGLDAAVEWASVVVTGEGSLDAQSAYGKTTAHVIANCRARGRDCLAVAGVAPDGIPPGLRDFEESGRGLEPAVAMARGAELVSAAAARLLRRWAEARTHAAPR